MKARIIRGLIDTGNAAREFIHLASGRKQSSLRPIAEEKIPQGAPSVLESFRNQRRQRETDILNGKRVIATMNEQLRGYSSAGEQFADWVTRGCHVSIRGDDRRFTVIQLLWEPEAIRIRSDEGYDYEVPFKVIRPWPKENDE